MPPLRSRTAEITTALVVLLTLPAAYALLRMYDVAFREEPDPATTSPSEHIAMFWRVGISSWLALATIPLVLPWSRANPRRALDVLQWLLPAVVALVLVQAAVAP